MFLSISVRHILFCDESFEERGRKNGREGGREKFKTVFEEIYTGKASRKYWTTPEYLEYWNTGILEYWNMHSLETKLFQSDCLLNSIAFFEKKAPKRCGREGGGEDEK